MHINIYIYIFLWNTKTHICISIDSTHQESVCCTNTSKKYEHIYYINTRVIISVGYTHEGSIYCTHTYVDYIHAYTHVRMNIVFVLL